MSTNLEQSGAAFLAVYPALQQALACADTLLTVVSGINVWRCSGEQADRGFDDMWEEARRLRAACQNDLVQRCCSSNTLAMVEQVVSRLAAGNTWLEWTDLEDTLARNEPSRAQNYDGEERVLESICTELSREIEDLAEAGFGVWGAGFFKTLVDAMPSELPKPRRISDDDIAELMTNAAALKGSSTPPSTYVLTPLQKRILKELDGVALTKQALANRCHCDPAMFYRPTGLSALRERGLVVHQPGVGFFRPDAPPPDSIVTK